MPPWKSPRLQHPTTNQNPKSGLSVNELQKVFPASQTADEHANPVTPEVEQEVSPQLSTAEIGLLFSVKSSSTYNRNAIAAEKKRARARIGRAVVAKIPSGHMSWPPPPPPAKATGKRTAFNVALPQARSNVGDILSPKNNTKKLTYHTLKPPSQTDENEDHCDIVSAGDEVEPADEGTLSQECSEINEDAEYFDIPSLPQVAENASIAAEENDGDDASPTESVGQDQPIVPTKDRGTYKNLTTETGSEDKRMSGQCVRGKGWSWQHREPLIEKPKRKGSSDNEQSFRAEGDEAIMLSRGIAGGWKVASSKPLGRSSTRSRNLHHTRQKIIKPLRIRKKERTPYATTLHATNDFGARKKFQVSSILLLPACFENTHQTSNHIICQPYTSNKQGNSVSSCFSAPHNTAKGRAPLSNAVGLLKSRREDEFLKVWNSASIAANRRFAV